MTERYSSNALDRVLRAWKGDRLSQVCPGDLRRAKELLDRSSWPALHLAINKLLER